MTVRLIPDHYWVNVPVEFISEDGIKERREFRVKVRRLWQSEIELLTLLAKKGQLYPNQLLEKVVVDWSGVTESGKECPFSKDDFRSLCETYPVKPSIVKAYLETIGLSGYGMA